MTKIAVLKTTCFSLLILSGCLPFINVAAQDWAPLGAKWYYTYHEDTWGDTKQGYELMISNKDTLINGNSCKILKKTLYTPNGDTINNGREFIFIDSTKVFHFVLDTFYLMYDLNLKQGDTLYVKGPYGESGDLDSIQVAIDSTGFQVLSGDSLKILYTTSPQDEWTFGGTVVEKIGNLSHFFPNDYWGCDMGSCIAGLRCYEDSTYNYYNPYGIDCKYIYTNVTNIINTQESISIFPNPCSHTIYINGEFSQSVTLNIRLFNLQGQRILENTINSDDLFVLDISGHPRGIYFLEITGTNAFFRQKIVKQ